MLLLNLIAGILGVFLYTLIKARGYITKKGAFDPQIFVRENFWGWLIANLTVIALAVCVHFIPNVGEAIRTVLPGFKIEDAPVGFFGFGLAFGFGGKEVTK